MKNFLFIIAAVCMTALHGFAQTTGLKKNDLPIVYLPDSLSVHFISPEPIQYVDISTKNIIGDLPVKNVLRIRYKDTVKSKDAVVTIAGEKFLAQYHIQWSPNANALVKSEIEINPAETRPLDIGISLSQPELLRLAADLFCKHPEANLESAKAYGLKTRLNHIYTLGDYIFLDVSYDNHTKLHYDIDEFRFKIDDKKVTKATTVQSLEIKPEFVMLDQPGFSRHYRNVFIFKKFTFPGNKVLHVDLNEKQLSGRVITLEIPYKDILNADIIPLMN
jgi:conjugative transposon TraN protein